MIKNNILIALFLLFGYSLSAQKAFFVKPRAMMKTNRSFHYMEGFGKNQKSALNYAHNGFYTFVDHGNHFTDIKVNLGISVGVKFDERNSLELVVSQDGSSVKQSFVYYDYNGYNGYLTEHRFLWGRDFYRVNLEYNRTVLVKPRYELRFLVGAGLFLANLNVSEYDSGIESQNFTANILRSNYNFNEVAPIFQLGFGVDFKTKKDLFLFSLDIYGTMSFGKPIQGVQTKVSLMDHSDQSIHFFRYTQSSRGSGINFQLSRPIQFYPRLSKKKEIL